MMNSDFLTQITGWNWISVNAIQDDMDINSAFSTLPAAANDYIKSQVTAATYYDGYGWYPAFDINVKNMYLLKYKMRKMY